MTDVEPGVLGGPTEKPVTVPKVVKIGVGIALASGVALAGKEGLLSDKPEDYRMPTGHTESVETPKDELWGFLRPESYTHDLKTGEKTGEGHFQIKLNTVTDGSKTELPTIYKGPYKESGSVDPEVIANQYGINLRSETLAGWPVFGQTTEDSHILADGKMYGEWIKVVGKDKDTGKEVAVFIPGSKTTKTNENLIISVEAGK